MMAALSNQVLRAVVAWQAVTATPKMDRPELGLSETST